MRRALWIVTLSAGLGCSGANRNEYATAAGFAATAGALQAAQAVNNAGAPPPPCGRDVFVCRGASERVCTTDKNGCEVCSCVRPAGTDIESHGNPNWWH